MEGTHIQGVRNSTSTIMPRKLWAISAEQLEVREYELPEPGEGQVLVNSEYGAAKHGTEMAYLKGYGRRRGRFDRDLRVHIPEDESQKVSRPVSLGNMFVGAVTKLGSRVTELSEGDRVLGYGPFQEVHVVRDSGCWKMPEGLSWKSAVCLDPADFAMAAVRDGQVRIGDAVAVFGMGAIGLLVLQLAKLSGAEPIIAVEPLPNRRQVAKASGADLILDPGECDPGIEIKKATGGRGVDVAIDYSGSVGAMQAALRSVAFGGNVVAGAYPNPYGPGLDLGAEAHLNIPNIIFSRACSQPNREHPRWNEGRIYATCWRLIVEGKLSGGYIVSPVVPFEELVTEYPKIASDPGANIKLGTAFG